MNPSMSELSISSTDSTQKQQHSSSSGPIDLAQVHFADVCHELPFSVLQQHLGGKGRLLRGLRAAGKAGQELVNSLITEAGVLLRSQVEPNCHLAKYVSQLQQLKELTLKPAVEGPYKVDVPIWERDEDGSTLWYGPAPDDTPLNQFAEAISQTVHSVTSLDISDWTLSAATAQMLIHKFPGVKQLTASIGKQTDQHQLFLYMSQWATLRELKLRMNRELLDASISMVTQVTQLHLNNHQAGSIKALSGMTNLESLSIPGYAASPEEPNIRTVLEQLTKLQELRVRVLSEADMNALAELPVLGRVEFQECEVGSTVPSMPSLQQVHSSDAVGVARVLAACHNVEVVNLGAGSVWQFQLEMPDIWPPLTLPMSDEQKVKRLEALATIDAWVAVHPDSVNIDTLEFHEMRSPEEWDFLSASRLQNLSPICFVRVVKFALVYGISQQVVDFLVAKFPCLRYIKMSGCSFLEGVSLMPLISLPLMKVQMFYCRGVSQDSLAALQDAFETQRPGQVTVRFT